MHDLVREDAALGWVDPPSPEQVREVLARAVAGQVTGESWLAVALDDAGAVVGLGHWHRYDRPTLRPHVELRQLAVAPQAQGRGVGRALLDRLLAAARRCSVEVVTLDLRADNEAALRLYERAGFEVVGRRRAFVATRGRRFDQVLCALDLR